MTTIESLARRAVEWGVVDEVESIEMITDEIGERAMLINNEIIFLAGGGSRLGMRVADFLLLLEKMEEHNATYDNPVKAGGAYGVIDGPHWKIFGSNYPETRKGNTTLTRRSVEKIRDKFKL